MGISTPITFARPCEHCCASCNYM